MISGISAKEASDLLFQLLLEVVRRHQPEIEPVLLGGANIAGFTPELMARALQAQGIWFQLLSIADQNAAMRRRRQIERTRGRDALRGTFAHVLAEAADAGIPPQEIQSLLSSLRIRPVITAHPTESKRVTVLEKYRKIYLLLRELEMPRWTERERTALIDDLRDQIELVWMTGELHLEKPTVQHEVSRGLHFFDEALFEKAPELLGLVDAALEQYYPGKQLRAAALPAVWLLDRRRPRRQSLGDDRGHRLDVAAERARLAAALSRADRRVWPRRCPSPSARFPCRRASSPSLSGRFKAAARRSRSRPAIPARPTGNFSRSCCASSTPPSPASRGRISAAPARPMPTPRS